MMKKNKHKIIISALAGLLMLGSFAAGFSLYKKDATDKNISIGIDTNADLNLRASLGSVTGSFLGSGSTVGEIGTQNVPVSFWGDKSGLTGSGYHQDVVVGKATFKFTTTNTTLQSELTVAITNNYTPGTWGAGQTLTTDGTWSANTKTWTGFLAVPVGTSDEVAKTLTFTLGVEHDTDEVALAIAEATYTINITFEAAEVGYDYAYIVGIGGDWSSNQDKYRMYPSLTTAAFEWEYVFFEGDLGPQEFKAKKLDDWSAGGNYSHTPAIGDMFRWTGSTSAGILKVN